MYCGVVNEVEGFVVIVIIVVVVTRKVVRILRRSEFGSRDFDFEG